MSVTMSTVRRRLDFGESKCPSFYDLAYLDALPPANSSRRRARFTQEQAEMLNSAFEMDIFPSKLRQEALACSLGVPVKRIQNWFQNKRSKRRKVQQMAYAANNTLVFHNATVYGINDIQLLQTFTTNGIYQSRQFLQIQEMDATIYPTATFHDETELVNIQSLPETNCPPNNPMTTGITCESRAKYFDTPFRSLVCGITNMDSRMV